MKSEERPTSPLGDYIKEVRTREGVSTRKLALETETTASQISRIESGSIATPNPELLKRIADFLDIDFAKLLRLQGIDIQAPDLQTYLRRNYNLSAEGVAE